MSSPTQTGHPPTPEVIFGILGGYQRTAALRAAIELNVFGAIGEGARDVASIARYCGTSERGTRILCDFLAIDGLLQKENGMYSHTPLSGTFLDPKSPACIASTALFMTHPALMESWTRLSETVRQGRTVLPGEGSMEPEHPMWVDFARHMAPMMRGMAPALASLVLSSKSGPMRVLDIAAGHGVFGIQIALQNPDAQIVALDWAAVLKVAEENARAAGVDTRYELRPGSAFDADYGGPYDAVLLTNFLHHFDHATCVMLLKRVRAACAPGAVVATLDFVPADDRISPPTAAAFSMTMLASTAAGDAYTFKEFERMYQEAGFRDVSEHALPQAPESVILGVAG